MRIVTIIGKTIVLLFAVRGVNLIFDGVVWAAAGAGPIAAVLIGMLLCCPIAYYMFQKAI